MFQGGLPSLLCYVDAVLPNHEVRCLVINGAWSFIMDQRSGHAAWQSPSGGDASVFLWAPMADIPGVSKGHYNSVLEAVRESGFVPGQPLTLRLWWLRASSRVSEFLRRVPMALSAFMAVMGGSVLRSEAQGADDRDDIAF